VLYRITPTLFPGRLYACVLWLAGPRQNARPMSRCRPELLDDLPGCPPLRERVWDDRAPEAGRRGLDLLLANPPGPREPLERSVAALAADSSAPVLPHDEALGHVERSCAPYEGKARPMPIDPEEERRPVLLGPVVIEIAVTELAMLVDVGTV
jgi:hypothetical protein